MYAIRSYYAIPSAERGALERAAGRVGAFAAAQLASLGAVDVAIPGGRAGHEALPVELV